MKSMRKHLRAASSHAHAVGSIDHLAPGANRSRVRSWAFRASSSRFRGGALVVREWINRWAAAVTSSTARSNAASFARDGRLLPLNLRTNWRAEARISSSVAGGEKLERVLIFRHMHMLLRIDHPKPRGGGQPSFR